MKLIGLTGGIGTGKSTVAELLRKRGWEVVASDDTSREVMNTDPDVRKELIELFGESIVSGSVVNTGLIADAVFGSNPDAKAKLTKLNRIIHPRVLDRHMQLILDRAASESPLLAIESALLYEVGLEDGFDWVLVVDAPEDVCVDRATKRLGISPEQARARMAEQMDMKEKRGHADFVIDNAGSLAELEKAVDTIAMIVELLPERDDEEEDEELDGQDNE